MWYVTVRYRNALQRFGLATERAALNDRLLSSELEVWFNQFSCNSCVSNGLWAARVSLEKKRRKSEKNFKLNLQSILGESLAPGLGERQFLRAYRDSVSTLLLLSMSAPRKWLAVAVACAGLACGSHVLGVFALNGGINPSSLVSLNITDGTNITLGTVDLGPITQTFPAFSVQDAAGVLYVACSTSDAIYAVTPMSPVTVTKYAPLPKYDADNDAYIGLQFVKGKLYLITQSGVYGVLPGSVTKMVNVTLPQNANCASSTTGGTGGAGQLFVADGDTTTIYTLDVGNLAAAPKTVKSRVNNPWDLA